VSGGLAAADLVGTWRLRTWTSEGEDGVDDEWQDSRCCFRPESMALIDALVPIEEVGQPLKLAS
jgi:hypothetical protein